MLHQSVVPNARETSSWNDGEAHYCVLFVLITPTSHVELYERLLLDTRYKETDLGQSFDEALHDCVGTPMSVYLQPILMPAGRQAFREIDFARGAVPCSLSLHCLSSLRSRWFA